MKKFMKIVLSIIAAIVITVLAIPIILGILLHSTYIQNTAVNYLTEFASEYTGTEIDIKRVDIKLVNRASISGIFVRDMQGDTLLYAKELTVGVKGFNIFSGNIALGKMTLDSACFYLQRDSLDVMNLKYLTDYLKSKNPKPSEKPFRLTASEFRMNGTKFKMRAYDPPKRYGINFKDLKIDKINIRAKNISIIDDSISLQLRTINFVEKSGITIRNLSVNDLKVSGTGLRFDGLNIETNFSNLNFRHLYMLYPKWNAFNNFTSEVIFNADIVSSILSYNTLQIFIPRKMDIASHIVFSGTVNGPVKALEGRLTDMVTKDSRMSVGFKITGLPNIKETVFDINLRDMKTDSEDIASIYHDLTDKDLGTAKPMLDRLGDILFEGNFKGYLYDFDADGLLTTAQGIVDLDFNFIPQADRSAKFIGKLAMQNFALGSLIANPKIGNISVQSRVDGIISEKSFKYIADANVKSLYFNGYNYSDITVKGEFGPKTFNGFIGSEDPNLNLNMNGKFDFTHRIPAYEFNLNLANADLKKLNFVKNDSVAKLSTIMYASAEGSNIDNINGDVTISKLYYINSVDTVRTGIINLSARNDASRKMLKMTSGFADVTIQGKYGFREFIGYFTNTMKRYLPALPGGKIAMLRQDTVRRSTSDINRYYMMTVNVKQANNVTGIFVPGLKVAEGTKATLMFNPDDNQFSMALKSEYIERNSLLLSNLSLDGRSVADSVTFHARVSDLAIGNTILPNVSLIGGIHDNVIGLGTRFSDPDTGTEALISTKSTLSRSVMGVPQMSIHFYPTSFSINRSPWQISSSNVIIDSTGVEFDNFEVSSGKQTFGLEGKLSRNVNDSIVFKVSQFNIKPFSALLKSVGMNVTGLLSGKAIIHNVLGEPMFIAGMRIKDMTINGYEMGNPTFISDWERSRRRMQLLLKKDDGKAIVAGTYIPSSKQYIATIDIPNIEVGLLDSLLSGVLDHNRGYADAKLNISGRGGKPVLNGEIGIRNFSTRIDFTNTNYFVDKTVMKITNNQFEIKGAEMRDEYRGRGELDLRIRSTYLSDMAIEVDARLRNMRSLNTTIKDNPAFYGRVNTSGEVFVRNYNRSTSIKIVATTDNDSEFYLPLTSNESISEADFITFVDENTRSEAQRRRELAERHPRLALREMVRRRRIQSDMNIDMLLNVRSNAEMQIVIDPKLGNVIRGRGDGTIKLNINPTKDIFSMYGNYRITQGTYLFTLQNFINKRFVITDGSSVNWTGNPVDPTLNISARYEVKTPLSPLLGASEQYNRNTNVYCVINLTDKLLQPVVKLDITVPNADPETSSRVANALNTEANMSSQFMYLLMVNSFNPDGGYGTARSNNFSSIPAVTGLEFLTNQISNWISGDKMDIRFRYRPKSDMTSDEVELMFATDIIRNKLALEVDGNYDFGNNKSFYTPTAYKLYGDIYLTYFLNDSRTLSIKGFTRTIDRFDETQGLQESGAGIYYRKDFNTFKEWMQELRQKREERKEKKEIKKSEKEKAKEAEKPKDDLVTFGAPPPEE